MEATKTTPYAKGASFDELWSAIEAAPTDGAAHDRFITFAVACGRHLEAIERYKGLGEKGGELTKIAEEKKKSVAMRMAATLLAATPRTTIDRKRARKGGFLLGAGIIICIIATWKALAALFIGVPLVIVGVSEMRAAQKG